MLLLTLAAHAAPSLSVLIDRQGRSLYLLDAGGAVVAREDVGIGRGGLGEKASMGDLITPTGTFAVDLILSAARSEVSPAAVSRFPEHADLLVGLAALGRLWENMGRLDFDGDGAPDGAYGSGYIGLDAEDAVTGPKLRRYQGTPYWYSIALHGTPDPANLGAANSGGCVHVSADLLAQLITTLDIGSTVVIQDGPPITTSP